MLATALAVAAIAACGSPDSEKNAACAAETGQKIVVTDAWLRASPGRPVAAAYFTLCNAGAADDMLVAVESDAADAVELHETRMSKNGVASMTRVETTPLPVGVTVRFGPGGAHAMMIGLHRDIAAGDRVRLRLRFRDAGPIDVEAEARN